jgi:hypothetical protein
VASQPDTFRRFKAMDLDASDAELREDLEDEIEDCQDREPDDAQ